MRTREGVWGEATAFLERFRRVGWFDFILLAGFIGLVFGLFSLAGEWRTLRPAVRIEAPEISDIASVDAPDRSRPPNT